MRPLLQRFCNFFNPIVGWVTKRVTALADTTSVGREEKSQILRLMLRSALVLTGNIRELCNQRP